jgi:hypothetical protein
MKRLIPLLLLATSLVLAILACSLPQPSPQSPPPTETPTSTIAPTDNPLPTETLAAPLPTEIPPSPTPEATASPYQPVGYYVVPPTSGNILVYNLNYQIVTQLSAPGLYGDNPSYAHLAGHISNGPGDLSVTYYSWEARSLMLTNLNGVNTLLSVPEFYMLAGIPSMPYIAFSRLEYADSGLRSYITVGNFENLATAVPVMTFVDTASYAIRPLAVAHNQGQPLGLYYTTVPYGIGGDLVFEPRRSLYYLDLVSYQSQELLGIGSSPSGFSPDLTWLAYTPLYAGPLTFAHSSDLSNSITLPLLPDSDRGAGDAVFSPDNQYIAWKEGSGWLMAEVPDFHATIRIATTTGTITAQIPDVAIAELLGNPSQVWVQPVGWLDAGTLLLEARGDDWENATLLRVNPDGSGLGFLVPGGFMGFVYP